MRKELSASQLIQLYARRGQKLHNKKRKTAIRPLRDFWSHFHDFESPEYAKRACRNGDHAGHRHSSSRQFRLNMLLRLAGLKIHRNRPYLLVRNGETGWGNVNRHRCFVCGASAKQWHHIIQVQNGGDNHSLNRVPLCEVCHSEIHPWVGAEADTPRIDAAHTTRIQRALPI